MLAAAADQPRPRGGHDAGRRDKAAASGGDDATASAAESSGPDV